MSNIFAERRAQREAAAATATPAAASEVPQEIEVQVEGGGESPSLVDNILGGLADGTQGIVKGVRDAAQSTLDLSANISNEAIDAIEGATGADLSNLQGPAFQLPEVDAPETWGGQLNAGVTQFLSGFLAMNAVAPGTGLAKMAAKGAAADFVSFNGFEGRLTDFIQEHTELEGPVLDYLATDPSDHWAEARFKNAVEGFMIGGALDAFVTSVRGLKGAITAKATKKGSAQGIFEEAMAEADETLRRSDAETGARQAADEDEIADSASPKDGPRTAAEELDKRGVQQRFNEDEIAEMAQRLERGDGDLAEVSEQFNPRRWDTPEQVDETINEVVARLRSTDSEVFDSVQSEENVRRMARSFGMDQSQLMDYVNRMAGDGDVPGDIDQLGGAMLALDMRVVTLGDQMSKMLPEYLSLVQVGDEAGAQLARDKIEIVFNIWADDIVKSKQLGKGTARALASRRAIREVDRGAVSDELYNVFDDVGGNFDEFVQKAAHMGKKPHWLFRAFRYAFNNKTWDVANELFINGILSGAKTHIVNVTSTGIETILRPAENTLGAALRGDTQGMRSALSHYAGLVHAIGDSWEMAKLSFRQDRNLLDPAHAINELTTRRAIRGNPATPAGRAINTFGTGIRLPGRFLMAEDEFFKQINYRARRYQQGYEAAVKEGITDPRMLSKRASEWVEQGFDIETGRAIDRKAIEWAEKTTFTADIDDGYLWGIPKGIQHLVNEAPALRQILPFVRTPINLLRNVTERTPFGLAIDRQMREDLFGGNPVARSEALSRMAVGSALMGVAAWQVLEGRLLGKAPDDQDLKRQFYDAGKLPYSIKIGDTYFELNRLDPRFAPLGMVADAIQAAQADPDAGMDEIASSIVMSLSSATLSKTYLQGVSEFLEAITTDDPEEVQRYLRRQVPARVMPFSSMLRQLNPDREIKDIRSVTDAFLANVPGLSGRVPAKRNVLGEKILRSNDGFISPVSWSQAVSDPVKRELGELQEALPIPSPKVRGTRIDMRSYVDPKTGQTAYDWYQERVGTVTRGGKTLAERLNDVVTSSSYQRRPALPDYTAFTSDRTVKLREHINKYRDKAFKDTLKKFPHLELDLKIEERNKKRARRHGQDVIEAISQ